MSKDLMSDGLTTNIYQDILCKLDTIDNKPRLAIIRVGDRKESNTYINLNGTSSE